MRSSGSMSQRDRAFPGQERKGTVWILTTDKPSYASWEVGISLQGGQRGAPLVAAT